MADAEQPQTLAEPSADRGERRDELVYEPGEQIAARYEVRARVGRGATAAVYRVFDHASHEEVAVKLIADSQARLDEIRREVRLGRAVTHRNVCRVFDLVEHRHGVLISMEYAAGGTLADRVGRAHDDDEVRRIAAQVLDGLEAAHAAGVIHRDLKPANVLIAGDGTLKLSDFGVAQATASVVETERGEGGLTGTPAYMAPEQLRGEAADERSDLYALGLVLHELIVGRLPFVAAGEAPSLPASLRRLERDIPPLPGTRLDGAIRALLARDPAKRPANVAAARARLGIGDGYVAPTRRRWLALAAVVAALAAIAITWRVTRTSDERPRAVAPAPVTRALTRADELIVDPPAFVGDDALVIATNRDGSPQLWRVGTDDAIQRPLTTGAATKRGPQLAGGYLYYRRDATLVRIPAARAADATPWRDDDPAIEIVADGVGRADVGPDGRIVLSEPDAPHRLLIQERDGARRVLHDHDQLLGSAQWSPDGRHVAFGDEPWEDVARHVWIVDVATGAATKLAEVPRFAGLAWTADSRTLVTFRGDGDARELIAITRDTGAVRVLATRMRDAARPVVGPGGRLAYLTDAWSYDLWIAENGRLRQATFAGDELAMSPHWVGDGLIYAVERPDAPGLELRHVGGPSLTDVLARRTIPAVVSSLAIAPDGGAIAYTAHDGGRYAIRRTTMAPDAPSETLVESDGMAFALQFAPGGRLAWTRTQGAEPGVWDLAGNGGSRLLVADAGGGFHSADGRWLAYTAAGSPTGMWLVAKDPRGLPTGAPRPVAGSRTIANARWHPTTGELIVMDEHELAAVSPDGARRHLLTWPPTIRDLNQLAVHPDGRVACSLASGRSAVQLATGLTP